ncbi:hypothetical protein Tco_1215637 [Tanacetum coccineum]
MITTLESCLYYNATIRFENQLPQILTYSVKETLPGFNTRLRNALYNEMPEILQAHKRPLNREFNALNKLECHRFVILEESIHKSIHKNVWVKMGELMETSAPHVNAIGEGEKEEPTDKDISDVQPDTIITENPIPA